MTSPSDATPTPLRELPALPEAAYIDENEETLEREGFYSAEQMRAYALAALSARDEAGAVAYDRELVADMLGELVYDEGFGPKSRSAYTVEAIEEQVRLLREADNAEAARVGTGRLATPPASGEAGADAQVIAWTDGSSAWLTVYGRSLGPGTRALIDADRLAAVAPASDHIDAMVNRFLGWRLPDDFAPDNGISYAPIPRHPDWTHDTHPTGTNLFHAGQARAMFAHCVAAVAPAGMDAVFTADEVAEAMEVLRGRHGSTALLGEVLDDMERVLLAAAPTPPATAGQEPQA